MKVWEFIYNDYDEAPCRSVHFSKEGAEKAMNEHKEKLREWYNKMCEGEDEDLLLPFGSFETWNIQEIEILP